MNVDEVFTNLGQYIYTHYCTVPTNNTYTQCCTVQQTKQYLFTSTHTQYKFGHLCKWQYNAHLPKSTKIAQLQLRWNCTRVLYYINTNSSQFQMTFSECKYSTITCCTCSFRIFTCVMSRMLSDLDILPIMKSISYSIKGFVS